MARQPLTKAILREQLGEWRRWCDEILDWYAQAGRPGGSVEQMMEAQRRKGWAQMAKALREQLDEFEAEWLVESAPERPRLRLVVDNEKSSETSGGAATPPDGGNAA